MRGNDSDIVLGLLLHVGGVNIATPDSQKRIAESIAPVNKEWGIWQAKDNYVGASWIVALGCDEIYQLTSYRNDGTCWRTYKPCALARIVETANDMQYDITASVASFHDSKHDLAPAALLRIGRNYVYRNASGHAVPLHKDLAEEILELNDIKT